METSKNAQVSAPGPESVEKFLSLCRDGAKIIRCEDGKIVDNRPIYDDEKPAVFAASLEILRERFYYAWTFDECRVCGAKEIPESFELISCWKDTNFFAFVSEVCDLCYEHIVSSDAFANADEIARKLG